MLILVPQHASYPMVVKFIAAFAGQSHHYSLIIEWKEARYQALLLCLTDGNLMEYFAATPARCIREAKTRLNHKGVVAQKVKSVSGYLDPINETIDAIGELTKT